MKRNVKCPWWSAVLSPFLLAGLVCWLAWEQAKERQAIAIRHEART